MSCPRCNGPANEETLREFGGVCPKCLLQFSEEQDAPAFPNLEIIEMVGQGGMGVVYKARQRNLDRIVALKVLSPQLSDDPEFVERFTREAKALAQLNHPNIVAIHDSGIHDHVPYLVMEFVDGTPLRNVLASGKLTPDKALEVIPQVCDALQYAHANGIVHRDIKPENILIDRQGRVKIADFGLAKLSVEQSKLTQSGFVLGTPRYMAPEQFEPAGRVDHRADIYSLGVVFYEMLTGEVPMGRFKPPSAKADVDRRLDPVVLKSLEREPEDRYQSANEVKDQVANLKHRPAVERRKPIIVNRTPTGLKRAAFIAANIGGLGLGAGLILSLMKVGGLADLLMRIGWSILLAALVLWLLSLVVGLIARAATPATTPRLVATTRRFEVSGCLVLIVVAVLFLAFMALLMWPSTGSSTARSVAPRLVAPPHRQPHYSSITQSWTENLPGFGDRLGVIAGKHSFLAVTKEEICEFEPETGKFVSMWSGAVEAMPVLEGESMAAWGGGKLTLFQTRPSSLTRLHTLDLPLAGAVAGVSIQDGTAYVAMRNGGAFAADVAAGKILWKRERFNLTPPLVSAPVVTSLDILLFSSGGSEVIDRERGASKSWTQGGGGSERMIQWDQGWGMLIRKGSKVEFESFFKRGMNSWYGLSTSSTADVDQCWMLLVNNMLVFTTINEMHGLCRNAPFGDTWRVDCPRTTGVPASFKDETVLVPTVKGVLFFDAQTGKRLDHDLLSGSGAVSVACWKSQVLLLDHDKARLLCYRVEE
jgi:tRNA A-37 threonylcarbamoyl transferase component Bud32